MILQPCSGGYDNVVAASLSASNAWAFGRFSYIFVAVNINYSTSPAFLVKLLQVALPKSCSLYDWLLWYVLDSSLILLGDAKKATNSAQHSLND